MALSEKLEQALDQIQDLLEGLEAKPSDLYSREELDRAAALSEEFLELMARRLGPNCYAHMECLVRVAGEVIGRASDTPDDIAKGAEALQTKSYRLALGVAVRRRIALRREVAEREAREQEESHF